MRLMNYRYTLKNSTLTSVYVIIIDFFYVKRSCSEYKQVFLIPHSLHSILWYKTTPDKNSTLLINDYIHT